MKRSLAIVLRRLGDSESAEIQISRAIQGQKQLVAVFPYEISYRETLSLCHATLAVILKARGSSKAVEQHRLALREFEGLVAQAPNDPNYRFWLACRQSDLGNLLAETGHVGEVETLFRSSLKTMVALTSEFPDASSYLSGLAERHVSLGRFLRAKLGKPEAGLQELRIGLKIFEKLAQEFPSVPAYRRDMADARIDLGQILMQQGAWGEAEDQFRDAIQLNQSLVNEFADVGKYRVSLAWSYCRMAELMTARGDAAESLQWSDRAADSIRTVYEFEGRNIFAREALVYILLGRAHALAKLKQDQPADWEMVRDAISIDGPQYSLIQRAIMLLRAGKVADAVGEMDALIIAAKNESVQPPWSLVEWFDAACFFSIASSKDSEREAEYGARAVELLKRAVAAGFTDAGHIQHDADLDPIRHRSDFKYLLESLNQASNASQRAK